METFSEHPDCQYAWGKADALHFCGIAHLRLNEPELARQRLTAALELREKFQRGHIEERNPSRPRFQVIGGILCYISGFAVEITTFVCGFAGSMIGEIFAMDESFRKGDVLPDRYRRFGFWAVRILIAAFGGGLAVAYKVQNPIAADRCIGAADLQGVSQRVQGLGSVKGGMSICGRRRGGVPARYRDVR